ncbi:MAG: DAK2 domain-containing protein [Coriobacteriales bacterium]|jgi:DAK2 domain fusion protein YloV|nr:DAK2 domain-containing protein [Coriobacteriales bacterium]
MISTDFVSYIAAGAHALSERKEEINNLNVFPVPDGDTGTNMSLTLETVVQELMQLGSEPTLTEIHKAVTHGSLMGARGNSGVITSQILRGMCEGIEQHPKPHTFDADIIASALARSVEVAFGAVRKPVEGTILTVLRDTADAAHQAAEDKLEAKEALLFVSEEAFASVRRTPDLLPVLKENGVVDAGGFGLAILIKGFVDALTGSTTVIPDNAMLTRPAPQVAIEQVNDWEGSEYRYCTEFLLRSDEVDSEETLDYLGTLGDCELLVGSHPDFKVHVHTNDPGTVLTYMTERGQVSEVHIHNMQLQTAERTEKLGGSAAGGAGSTAQTDTPPKPLGFIAVCAGEGTQRILESAGVDLVVRGGQTMNPSTKDFVDAIAAVNAEQIIIFPNNKNIFLAANAAAEVADRPVAVIPTKSVPQSFAALFAASPGEGLDENVALMNEAIEAVRSGEITTAIKDAKAADGSPIKEGDVIGIAEGAIDVVGSDVSDVALELVGIISADCDVLTMLAGMDFAQDDFEALIERIEERYPDLEIDAQRGEQPLYPLVMAAE